MRPQGLLIVLRDVLAVALPIAAAIMLAQQLALHDQRTRAEIMAGVVLNRTALTTEQLASAFERMAVFPPAEACSVPAVALMRQVDLGSSLLQGVGYIENDKLQCSSLGEPEAVAVGAPDYISATKTYFRRNRDLSIAPGTMLLLVSAQSGYTGLVHPSLIFNLVDAQHDFPAGVVSYSTREPIVGSGGARFDWFEAQLPASEKSGVLTMGGQLVAWERSPTWDHFTYAAVPLAAVAEEFDALSRWFLPVGVVVGLLVLFVVRRLAAGRASLPTLLRNGLKRNEILTVYQPIVDMQTGRWVGAEVLARWRRASGEWVSPEVFVPIAERHGLISRLTQRVVESCCTHFGDFVESHPDFFVSINISSADLRDPEFPVSLRAACGTRGLSPGRVHLEITERAEVDPAQEAETIRALRDAGFRVGIDDFGIGYSNLAYLDLLHVDYLKIDRAFVAGIARGQIGTEVIDHIIELAVTRGLEVIAEGVERADQRAELMSRGVRYAQGWLFARPMSHLEFAMAYAEHAGTLSPAPQLAQVA